MTESPGAADRSVTLDAAGDARLTRLTNSLAEDIGPQRPARADLLRALLVVAERNAGVRAAVRAEVQTDAVRRNLPGEIASIAQALSALTLETDEDRQALVDQAVALEALSAAPDVDGSATSERIREVAIAVEQLAPRLGATRHRPALALTERLQIVRDAVDPTHKTRCSTCGKPVRALAGGRPERHNDRLGALCPTSPRGS